MNAKSARMVSRALRQVVLAIACLGTVGAASPVNSPWPVANTWQHDRLTFANRSWSARQSDDPVAAGPSRWSSGEGYVHLDDNGHVRLRLKKDEQGQWRASEIATPITGYGRYEVHVGPEVSQLDPNVVAGVFIYRNDTSEFDVEFSRWGDVDAPNAQFVIAPPKSNRLNRFTLEPGDCDDGYRITIDWRPDAIAFSVACSKDVIASWRFSGAPRPQPNGHRLHINLWSLNGAGPTNQKAHELMIHSVSKLADK